MCNATTIIYLIYVIASRSNKLPTSNRTNYSELRQCIEMPSLIALAIKLMMLPPWSIAAIGIVEMFEWRFDDIALECELYLGPKGFDAVQVSPVAEPAVFERSKSKWLDRYGPVSYLVKSLSGDENEFRDMCQRCYNVGVKVYVEVVINNMMATYVGKEMGQVFKGLAGSEVNLTGKFYPAVPYSGEHFNNCDYSNTSTDAEIMKNCEFLFHHDLNQSHPHVRRKVSEFLNHLIELGASGFYVNAALYMWPEDLKAIYSQLKNTIYDQEAPFIYHDFNTHAGYDVFLIEEDDYHDLGKVTEYGHGLEMEACFGGGVALKWLSNYGSAEWMLMRSEDVISFVSDRNSRMGGDGLDHKSQPRAYYMATAFTLAWGYGTPRILSSHDEAAGEDDNIGGPPVNDDGTLERVEPYPNKCGGRWTCEHRSHVVFGMIEFANLARETNVSNFWDNGNNQISFCRGQVGFVAFNNEDYDLFQRLQTCLPPGKYCDVATGFKIGNFCTGRSVDVSYDGTAVILISHTPTDRGFLAIHLNTKV
ncbi:alpha-amylase [Nesidiocoris tenuis]|uniref:alpha-amylase n=1 Tax=Nesidiocoris tenuis TaxID=355587 RepID=A0ABN7B9U5_9HEMI|nr:alpha-amylase [Nesidiocoris tenuis]